MNRKPKNRCLICKNPCLRMYCFPCSRKIDKKMIAARIEARERVIKELILEYERSQSKSDPFLID